MNDSKFRYHVSMDYPTGLIDLAAFAIELEAINYCKDGCSPSYPYFINDAKDGTVTKFTMDDKSVIKSEVLK